MNKALIIILLVAATGFWACDTKDNIVPLNDSFFVKLYAGDSLGDQFGNDIIATTDGGLLIAGTSKDETANVSEILLIKTDERGNEIWTYGAIPADLGGASFSVAKSVIELSTSYLVGGTIGEGIERKSILLSINFDGTFDKSAIISTDTAGTPVFNRLSKITNGQSGILVTGETAHLTSTNGGGLNGFVSLYNEATLEPENDPAIVGNDSIWYFGVPGDDFVAGGYEVSDPNNSIGGQASRFLIFGSSFGNNINTEKKYYYVGYGLGFGQTPSPGIGATRLDNFPGNQTAGYVTQFDDTYWVIGDTDDNQMFLMGWGFNTSTVNNWSPIIGSGNVPTNDPDDVVIGAGIAVQSDNKYIIVGDVSVPPDNTEIYLVRVDGGFRFDTPPWPKTYGTATSTYSASAVTTLADGSIIIVGTADLEPIRKIVVIKTGPNGEMSF